MPLSKKKDQEVAFLSMARRLRPDLLPEGVSQENEGENPDIVVRGAGWAYGVEITGIISQADKAQEQARRNVCDMANELAALPMGYSIAVLFRPEKHIGDRAARIALATQLAARVQQHVEGRPPDETWSTELPLRGDPLHEWATQMFIHYIPDFPVSTWYSQEGWGVGPLLPDELRRRLSVKEGRLADYRLRAPRVLLLLDLMNTDLIELKTEPLAPHVTA
jgi:hypothetical protein